MAFHSVRESQLRFGDKVAVIGLGAIGLAAVKMAKSAGAEQIIAIDLIERRRQLALELGADVVIDPSVGDAALMVHQLTGGPGVDVAIEVAGAYPALDLAIRSTRITGTVCATGFYQGESRGIWLGREWHHNRLNMVVPHGCGWGHPPRDYPRWTQHRAYDAIVSMMRKGSLDLSRLITPILTLEESVGIFDTIKNRPEEVIKFAVRF